MNGKETLASRLGFILLSAGCAIGLGNVWRFPYICGQNGGGWFVLLYLVFLALLGLPVLVMEFTAGRASHRSMASLHPALTPDKPAWRIHGIAGLFGCSLLMMFYTTITGWLVLYFVKSLGGTGAFTDPGAHFSAMLADPARQIMAMTLVTLGSAFVCGLGLQKGVERITKVMMIGLLFLIIILAVKSATLDGAGKGLKFYLIPDFARMQSVGLAKVVVEAMNHAFFTLSLGIGSMAIFGSYIGRDKTLLGESLHVAALDTFVALTAGIVIIPACFAFGVDQAQGPGLVFVTLPTVFSHMTGGAIWGATFFLFMSCAALTTVIAVFECIIACVRELTGWKRSRACTIVGIAIAVLSLPCIFGFNVWSGFTPFGKGSCVLDLEDFLVSNLLLPLGGLAFAIYCTHNCGWGWQRFRSEANAGAGPTIPNHPVLRIYCAWCLPTLIFLIFIIGILAKFGGWR